MDVQHVIRIRTMSLIQGAFACMEKKKQKKINPKRTLIQILIEWFPFWPSDNVYAHTFLCFCSIM